MYTWCHNNDDFSHSQKYEGSFVNVIAQCGNSAQKLLQLLVQDFPSFRDTAPYSGRTGSFPGLNILLFFYSLNRFGRRHSISQFSSFHSAEIIFSETLDCNIFFDYIFFVITKTHWTNGLKTNNGWCFISQCPYTNEFKFSLLMCGPAVEEKATGNSPI